MTSAASEHDEHEPRLFRCAHRILGNVDDANEVVQETWLASCREGTTSFAWLLRTVRNKAIDRLRRPRLTEKTRPDAISEQTEGPFDAVAARESHGIVRTALARLSRRQRQVVTDRIVHQRTFAEIARALGLAEGTVKVHFQRGIDELRSRLRDMRSDA